MGYEVSEELRSWAAGQIPDDPHRPAVREELVAALDYLAALDADPTTERGRLLALAGETVARWQANSGRQREAIDRLLASRAAVTTEKLDADRLVAVHVERVSAAVDVLQGLPREGGWSDEQVEAMDYLASRALGVLTGSAT